VQTHSDAGRDRSLSARVVFWVSSQEETEMKDTATPTVTTGPLPASRKIHVAGDLHDIRVPMRARSR
jgi:hypothetical protein